MAAKIRCALYTRKSSEEGLDQNFNSLHAQRESCEAYVLSQAGEGWSALAAAYDDGGFSGGSMDRPGLKALMADIQKGLVDVVVVYKVDRLTRSLADFAKIVELFDAKGVSFVSVTQAFNTTTSMGRLTLNVLLSFAQFEREVTGERIRDKIAASRAKGLRMGARPPLGYDVKEGRLVVNVEEAERVQAIFKRYLEVQNLYELMADRIVSKRWVSAKGTVSGGGPMTRGPIHYLLTNPVYRGITRHKEKVYPDTHPAIVDQDLWDQVQAKLRNATNVRQSKGKLVGEGALLKGKVVDDRGQPMPPVHTRRGVQRYRYYVSKPCITGQGEGGSLPRVPAGELDRIVSDTVGPVLNPSWRSDQAHQVRVADALDKVTVSVDQIHIALRCGSTKGELAITVPISLSRRQSAVFIQAEGAQPTQPKVDRILTRAVVMARVWAIELETGRAATIGAIAKREGMCERYLSRLLPLAYMAPDLVQQILEGRQPRTTTLKQLTAKTLPVGWADQRRLVASAH
jgi:site-specific DNA recombinase